MASRTARDRAVEHARKRASEFSDELQKLIEGLAGGTATWKDVARVRAIGDLTLDSVRFDAQRILFDKRPDRISFVAADMARRLSTWADQIDDPAETLEVREQLKAWIGKLRLKLTRIASTRLHEVKDQTFQREVLRKIIEDVAFYGSSKGPWGKIRIKVAGREVPGVLADPRKRWIVLAEDVIRIYIENVDPLGASKLRKQRTLIARAVEASSNRGGRGRRPKISKAEAMMDLNRALGFGDAEYDSLRVSRSRLRKKRV